MKRTTAFILVLILVLSFFSGCNSEKPAEPTPSAKPEATQSPQNAKPDAVSEVGYWTLLKVDSNDPALSMDEEAVDMLKDLGMEIFIDLRKDGSGNFMLDEYTPVEWGEGIIKVADELEMKYSIFGEQLLVEFEGDTYVFVKGEGEAPVPNVTEDPVSSSAYSWWAGDWYGWWIIDTAYGSYESMEGYFWDAYANIELGEDDTAQMLLWDMDYSKDAPMADIEVFFSYGAGENGAMWAEDGYFMDADVGHAEWVADPAAMGFEIDDMIYIDFVYEDPQNPDNRFNGYIFLRPWGTMWDDVEGKYEEGWPYDDMMPFKYTEWYVPLVKAGLDMPDSYSDGVALVEDGLYGSGEVLAYGVWDDCTVEVVGAEHFVDSNGKDAIRVYYDFTNTGTEDICAMNVLSIEATQDEYTQIETYTDYDKNVDESANAYLTLRPGVTIRCVAEYSMKLSGGPLTMRFYDYWNDDDSFSVDFDPQKLPGRPPQAPWEQIINPRWLLNVSTEGWVGDAYVATDHVEYAEDENGDTCIRVYVAYTNNSDDVSAFIWDVYFIAYQDGIELQGAWMDENAVPEDDNIYEEIGPGQSIMTSVCYVLRNEQSPVEFQMYDSWTGETVGAVIELTWGG